MRLQKQLGYISVAISAVLMVSACGQNGTEPYTEIGGLYSGNYGTASMNMVVQGNGNYWLAYKNVGSTATDGIVFGNFANNSGVLTSNNSNDFSLSGSTVTALSKVTATALAKSSLSGTATGASTQNFLGTYNALSDTVPAVSKLVGTYVGTTQLTGGISQVNTWKISYSTDTSYLISATVDGTACIGAGTVRAAVSDKNYYPTTFTFGTDTSCKLAATSFSGVITLDGTAKQITFMGNSTDNKYGVYFQGVNSGL